MASGVPPDDIPGDEKGHKKKTKETKATKAKEATEEARRKRAKEDAITMAYIRDNGMPPGDAQRPRDLRQRSPAASRPGVYADPNAQRMAPDPRDQDQRGKKARRAATRADTPEKKTSTKSKPSTESKPAKPKVWDERDDDEGDDDEGDE